MRKAGGESPMPPNACAAESRACPHLRQKTPKAFKSRQNKGSASSVLGPAHPNRLVRALNCVDSPFGPSPCWTDNDRLNIIKLKTNFGTHSSHSRQF